MFYVLKEYILEIFESWIEIFHPEYWETVSDEMAAKQLRTTLSVIDAYVTDGTLKTNRDGEIYQRSINHFLDELNHFN